ncbi:hypothetical protein F4774DRAFT_409009 [Daldinia eschscholtzii]|nr:hypothetical protein F4774DRAFT_409009 [Daldinia eschscholtzii]
MGDPLGAVGSILGIAAFGLKFATTLQTYIEAVSEAQESLRGIAFDVSATASALEQLNEFIQPNQGGKAIANASGVKQVERLASQCEQVYTAIIHFIAKAVGVPKDGNGKVSLDALDLHSLNAPSRTQRLIWPFKEPRIKRHQEELRWLKISLLFHLRLMELAKTKMMVLVRSPTAYEKEVALEAALEKLSSQRKEYSKKMASQRRSKKNEVRRRSLTGSSSLSMVDGASSRSSSFKRRRILKKDDPPHTGPPSHQKNDGGKGTNSTVSSSKMVGNVTETAAMAHAPNSQAVKFESLHSLPVAEHAQAPLAELPSNSEHNGQEVSQNVSSAASTNARSQTSTRGLPMDAGAGQFAAFSGLTYPVVQGERTVYSHTIRHFNGRKIQAPKFPPRVLSAFLRLSRFFGRRNNPIHEWENQELEAYLVESYTYIMRKLHFDQKTLADELRRITKSSRYDLWAHYMSLTSAKRETVDWVTAEANRLSHHSRACVAIDEQSKSGQSCIVVLFSLGSPVEPIHVKYGDEYFQFGFELCRTWEGINGLIQETMNEIRTPALNFEQFSYELRGLDDHIIPRSMWSNTVRPGLAVSLLIQGSRPMIPAPTVGRLPPRVLQVGSSSCTGMSARQPVLGCMVVKESFETVTLSRDSKVMSPVLRPSSSASDVVESNDVFGSAKVYPEYESESQPDGEGSMEEDSEGEAGTDIINFEEEEIRADLELGVQLDMLTNAFSQAKNENDKDRL